MFASGNTVKGKYPLSQCRSLDKLRWQADVFVPTELAYPLVSSDLSGGKVTVRGTWLGRNTRRASALGRDDHAAFRDVA
jgi:hypothetical protein